MYLQRQKTSIKQELAIDGRLRPRYHHLATSTKHNVMLDFGPLAPICENMTSSTKPEVQCRQKRTKPRPQVTRTENLVKIGHELFDMRADRQTNRHTDTLIAILCPSTREAKYICSYYTSLSISKLYKHKKSLSSNTLHERVKNNLHIYIFYVLLWRCVSFSCVFLWLLPFSSVRFVVLPSQTERNNIVTRIHLTSPPAVSLVHVWRIWRHDICIAPLRANSPLKRSGWHVLTKDHTVLPATHTFNHV